MNINAFGGMGFFVFVLAFFVVLFAGISWTGRRRRRAARRAMDEGGYPFLSGGSHAPTSEDLQWDSAQKRADEVSKRAV